MLYWTIYDISSNKIRSRVANKCKNYGLERVQKSAFLGNMTKNKAEMLAIEVKDAVQEPTDSVFILPACEQCFSCREIIGAFNEGAAMTLNYFILGGNNEQRAEAGSG